MRIHGERKCSSWIFLFPEKFERRGSLDGKVILILVCGSMLGIMALISAASHMYNLNGIKSKTVGDGQHGAARFATGQELTRTFRKIPYTPQRWRRLGNKCTELKLPQGVVVGCQTKYKLLRDRNSGNRWPFRLRKDTYALVDTGDVHTMMIGAAGCGKTAFWLYPNLEYACASGMSFLTTDTKGDLYRNYVNICKAYGFSTSVIDLRNPTKSDSFNLLHLVNKYTDLYKKDASLAHKAKAEKYATVANGKMQISTPKTDSSVRTVYLSKPVLEALKEYRKTVDSQWVFPSQRRDELPLHPSAVRKRLHATLERAGCKDVRFHDLRHPYVKHATKIFSLRLKFFQAQPLFYALRETRRVFQHHLEGGNRNPFPRSCNKKLSS